MTPDASIFARLVGATSTEENTIDLFTPLTAAKEVFVAGNNRAVPSRSRAGDSTLSARAADPLSRTHPADPRQ
jgi:hypothetical protein